MPSAFTAWCIAIKVLWVWAAVSIALLHHHLFLTVRCSFNSKYGHFKGGIPNTFAYQDNYLVTKAQETCVSYFSQAIL